jgi:transposase-like protein
LDIRVTGQRRRWIPSPGEILVDGVLTRLLPVVFLASVYLAESPWMLLAVNLALSGAILSTVLVPRARRQVLVAFHELEEIQAAMNQLRHLESAGRALVVSAFLFLLLEPDSSSRAAVGALGVRVRTLNPTHLKSEIRTGLVEHHRVRTDHTETAWVIRINGPITIRIPRDDPDLADLLMVLLHEGRDDQNRRYLDQRTTGEIFALSRQMTNVRIALYKQRRRIEDVLVRNRDNHVLTTQVIGAVQEKVLEDPFVTSEEVRDHLVAIGLLESAADASKQTICQAMSTVDYLAVRKKILDLFTRGEISVDYEKLSQHLLKELEILAPIAGRRRGQVIVPIREGCGPPAKPSRPSGCPAGEVLPELPDAPGAGSFLRWSCLFYFALGASYREVGRFLGVSGSTVYRGFRRLRKILPVLQDVLGPLRHSGVVGLDEKFILVPKPHREGKMGRWMYLFFAIDPYSYDLLHIEIHSVRTTDSARTFLLGLKARGCVEVRAFVSDLWGPYETLIAEIFPGVQHHQCIFHAEQAASTLMQKHLGSDFRSIPIVRALRSEIITLFRARSRRTLIRRYRKLQARSTVYLDADPRLAPVFESLKTHFPRLATAYTSRSISIPKTNNAVESVIRIFTRRYKTMAGFDSLETAREYVELWAWYYRLRPFSPDARPHLRNRSPLEIAGYDLQSLSLRDCVMGPAPPQ